jgi:hypothetical protein
MFCDPGTAVRSSVPTVQKTLCPCQTSSSMILSASAAPAIHSYTTHRHYSNANRLMDQAVQMAFWWMSSHRNLYHCQWWLEVWTAASSREMTWSVRKLSSLLPPLEPLYGADCFIGIWLGLIVCYRAAAMSWILMTFGNIKPEDFCLFFFCV